jgi:hypothetical protein
VLDAGDETHRHAASTRTATLRLGVLVDARVAEGWVVAAVRAALAAVPARVAVVAMVHWRPRRSLAAAAHGIVAAADRLLRCRREPLLERVDVLAALAPTECLDLRVATAGDAWTIQGPEFERLRRCAVDFWLCCTRLPPRRPLVGVARRGVLGFEIGAGVSAASRWAGVAEIGLERPVTSTSIVDYSLAADGCLFRGTGATVASSSALNRLAALRRGVNGIARALAETAGDAAYLAPNVAATPLGAPWSRPTLTGIATASRSVVRSVATNRLRELRWREQWQIAYQFGAEDAPLDVERLRYLVPPPDRYWADPCALEHDNRYFVLFEEARFGEERGRIMVVEVHEDAKPGPVSAVLERPYHLSYPFLFHHDGALFMLPETAANGRIEAYRCEKPPWRWQPHAVLLENVRAFDATLWQAGDRWWLFASVGAPGTDGNDELHLYSSPSPFGPWRPHPRNPVVADARRARSAGPLFRRAGALYRPSQDCTPFYGRCIVINRVDVLDDKDYRETPVARIEPGWRADVRRVHTLGGSGRLRVIDCSVQRRRW